MCALTRLGRAPTIEAQKKKLLKKAGPKYRESGWTAAVHEALRQGWSDILDDHLLARMDDNWETMRKFVASAHEGGHLQSLQSLQKRIAQDRHDAGLVSAVMAHKWTAGIETLVECYRKTGYGREHHKAWADLAAYIHTPEGLIEHIAALKTMSEDSHSHALYNLVWNPQVFTRLLQASAPTKALQIVAPNRLAHVASTIAGNTDLDTGLINILLDAGMNANYDNGAVMAAVLKRGDIALAERMVRDFQFEPSFFINAVYPALLKESAPPDALKFAQVYAGQGQPVAGALLEHGFTMVDSNSVAVVQNLPQGGALTTVFNFSTAQQVLIAQAPGVIAPATVVAFSSIENRAQLSDAADAFIAGGGDPALVAQAGVTANHSIRKMKV